jgi:hypothetical protein
LGCGKSGEWPKLEKGWKAHLGVFIPVTACYMIRPPVAMHAVDSGVTLILGPIVYLIRRQKPVDSHRQHPFVKLTRSNTLTVITKVMVI